MRRVGFIVIEGERDEDDPQRAGWNVEQYEREVESLVRQYMLGYRVSWEVMLHLRLDVTIVPFRPLGHEHAVAYANPSDRWSSMPSGAPDRFSRDSDRTAWDDTGLPQWIPPNHPRLGTGRGSRSIIYYTPRELLDPRAPVPLLFGAPLYADAVLLHELVHALRYTWAVDDGHRFDPNRRWGWHMRNTEEYYAHMVENMYRSEVRIPMQTAYLDFSRMRLVPNPQGMSHPYIRLERRWIGRWFQKMPGFCNRLAGIPVAVCDYNPFRNYLTHDYPVVPAISPTRMPNGHELIGPPEPPPPPPTAEDIFGPHH